MYSMMLTQCNILQSALQIGMQTINMYPAQIQHYNI